MPLFGRPTPDDDARAEAWRDWFARRNLLAIASFVLGLFSLIEFGVLIIFGVAGIVLGVVAWRQMNENPGQLGRRFAVSGIVMSALSLVIAVFLYARQG